MSTTPLTEPSPAPQSLAALLSGFADAAALHVSHITADSREIRPGGLFLACRGHGSHGLAHLPQALRQGAAAVAWEPAPGVEPPRAPVPCVEVSGLGQRAGEIAARFYGRPSSHLFMIGITGTDGKTSTVWLVSQALAHLGQRCGYLGTLGYGLPGSLSVSSHTTPEAVAVQHWLARFVASGVESVAMEVSSHALDQGRVNGVEFDVAVLTNVTRDHLDYHGDVIRYAEAKRKLFSTPGLKSAVLNQDDVCGGEWLRGLSDSTAAVAYGLGGPAHPSAVRSVLGEEPELTMEGLRFGIRAGDIRAVLQSRLLGRFNAYNLLAALAVLLEKGIPLTDALAALAKVPPVPGRMQALRAAGRPLAVVDYAHTPDALDHALEAVRAHVRGKLICVFGCGGDRDRGKRPLMAEAVARGADLAIVTDDNPRSEAPAVIVRDILTGFPAGYRHRVEHDRARAITIALTEAGPDDAVLIAGKGHEDYQLYGAERRHFSDSEVARRVLAEGRDAA